MTSPNQLAMDGTRLIALVWLFSMAIVAWILLTRAIRGFMLYRRMHRRLPPPQDPRLTNLVSLQDWKKTESTAKRLRRAA